MASVLKLFADAMFSILAPFDRAVKYNQAQIFRINNADSELSWESKYKLLEERLTDKPKFNDFRAESTIWSNNYKLEFSCLKNQKNSEYPGVDDMMGISGEDRVKYLAPNQITNDPSPQRRQRMRINVAVQMQTPKKISWRRERFKKV